MHPKYAAVMAISVDPDQTAVLSLYCPDLSVPVLRIFMAVDMKLILANLLLWQK